MTTDATTPEQPRTAHNMHELNRLERGRSLNDDEIACYIADHQTAIRHGTALIGDEIAEQLRDRIEAQARPPVASEGLRAALEAMKVTDPLAFATDPDGDCFFCAEPTGDASDIGDDYEHDKDNPECPATRARAALAASDAGRSVGALDPERLARALTMTGNHVGVAGEDMWGLTLQAARDIAAAYDAERQGWLP